MQKSFVSIWFGQTASMIGSGMTWFALTIWAWQQTEQPTTLSMVSFFAFMPTVVFMPLAGVYVDRWSRKLVMLFSDAATAIGTLLVLVLYQADMLEIWHIYMISGVAGFFTAFQYPAYVAAITTMLPKDQYTRAQGMMALSPALAGILAPVFATNLLSRAGMSVVMSVDLATFLLAFVTLIWARIPRPKESDSGRESRGSIRHELAYGFQYIFRRLPLRNIVLLFMAGNFVLAIGATLIAPLVLSQTKNNEAILASVQSIGAIGGVTGGILMSFWVSPYKRIHLILLGGFGACLLGIFGLGLGGTFLIWAIANFFFAFFEPFVEGGNISIWQSKVEPDVQGRVLSSRQILVQVPYLIGILISGPLAEHQLGIQPALLAAGFLGCGIFLFGYFFKSIRRIETILPDQGA